ncbi:MAG: tetratricopeptide repeat protein [Betaproteobacteria bacterium]
MEHWRSYLRGRILEAFGLHGAALSAYRDALAAKPAFDRPAGRSAYLLAGMDRPEEAEKFFRLSIAANPANAATHFNLGFTLDKRGLHDAAVTAFREAVRLRPGLDRAWYGLGMALAALGRHAEAAVALHEAATLQPMNPHAWYALGMAHHALGDAERVKEVALHMVRFDPRMTRRLIRESGATGLDYLVKDLVV